MPLELEVLLKNFLVAGLVDGILCFLGGQSIQQIHPNPIFDLFFKIYRTAGTSRGTLAWLITTAKAMVGSTPTSATNFQNGWGFSKRRILIRFVKWGQHPYQLPFTPGEYPINTQHGKKPPLKGNLLVAGDNFSSLTKQFAGCQKSGIWLRS